MTKRFRAWFAAIAFFGLTAGAHAAQLGRLQTPPPPPPPPPPPSMAGEMNAAGRALLLSSWGALDGAPPFEEAALADGRARCAAPFVAGSQDAAWAAEMFPALSGASGDLFVGEDAEGVAVAIRTADGWTLSGGEDLQDVLDLGGNSLLFVLYSDREIDPGAGDWTPSASGGAEPKETLLVQFATFADGRAGAVMQRIENFEAANSGEEPPMGPHYLRCGDLTADLAAVPADAAPAD